MALRRAGLTTIADLAVRPRGPLAARFLAWTWWQGWRVCGKRISASRHAGCRLRSLSCVALPNPSPQPTMCWQHSKALADEAQDALRERGEGGRRFAASLFAAMAMSGSFLSKLASPPRDPALLMRLFRERIEALADPMIPASAMMRSGSILPSPNRWGPVQTGLATPVAGDAEVAGLVDRLSTRLGRNRVQRLGSRDTHIPEQACFTFPATDPPDPMPWPKATAGEPPLRPLHLFDPPQPILAIAEVPDGPPRRFQWRRRTHVVVRYEGPERIASEWWRRRGA